MKHGRIHRTETEKDERNIVREIPNENGIGYERIHEKSIRKFQEQVEEDQKTTFMDIVAGVCPELARRLRDIAELIR